LPAEKGRRVRFPCPRKKREKGRLPCSIFKKKRNPNLKKERKNRIATPEGQEKGGIRPKSNPLSRWQILKEKPIKTLRQENSPSMIIYQKKPPPASGGEDRTPSLRFRRGGESKPSLGRFQNNRAREKKKTPGKKREGANVFNGSGHDQKRKKKKTEKKESPLRPPCPEKKKKGNHLQFKKGNLVERSVFARIELLQSPHEGEVTGRRKGKGVRFDKLNKNNVPFLSLSSSGGGVSPHKGTPETLLLNPRRRQGEEKTNRKKKKETRPGKGLPVHDRRGK